MTPQAIAEDLARFIHPDQYTELRALHVGGKGRTFAGWFDGRHLYDLARHALALSRQAAGVYFVPNPVDPAIAAKRLNTVLDVRKGFALTHDHDVTDRRFVIVDIDPRRHWYERPAGDPLAGQGQEAPTHWRELGFALQTARRHVRPFLADLGLPSPITMLSGNGVHLIYPVTMQAVGGIDPAAKLLRMLAERYTCWGLAVDPNTYTPARMLKVPGTVTRKGSPSPGRPHRAARIIEVPNGWPAPAPVAAAPAADRVARPAGEPERRPEPPRPGVGRAAAKPAGPAERPALFDGDRPGTAGH
jgi:hypothetical protein